MRFRKAGGEAQTYLQMGKMITIKMTDSDDLFTQIENFQENYMRILLNGQSNFSEDLITFTFCSNLPPSYKETTQQYLDNITDIKIYKLSDIITWILQEENHQKANTVVSVSLNNFWMVKNLGQKCAKCGKTNHSTQNHWPRGKHPQKGKGRKAQKASSSWENKNKKTLEKREKEKKRLKIALMYYQL